MSESNKLKILIVVGVAVLGAGLVSLALSLYHLFGLAPATDASFVGGRWVVAILGIPIGTSVLMNTKELM